MKKSFVIDTNVFLADPNAIFSFDDNDIYIPIVVIEEIDTFKKGLSEIGRNARHLLRNLDEMRKRGSLNIGVKIFPEKEDSGKLYVSLHCPLEKLPKFFEKRPDNQILAVALQLKEDLKKEQVILVTKDANLRVKGDALGLHCEDYEAEKVNIDELFTGIAEFEMPKDFLDEFTQNHQAPLENTELCHNQYLIVREENSLDRFVYGRYDDDTKMLHTLKILGKDNVWGIFPRNLEQSFALDLLLDDNIKLVTLVGAAGTGKTLMAIAAGLESITEQQQYQRLLVSRPIFPMGKDIGFLPGTLEEKLNPWMQPIYDNLELLLGGTASSRKSMSHNYHELMNQGILEVEPLTYIRGRSIPHQYFIVDEAQNLTAHEIKTILTRAGENTKIILTGDPYQIDNPYVDAASNGLTYVVERFRKEKIAGHITLVKGERSELATIAASIL